MSFITKVTRFGRRFANPVYFEQCNKLVETAARQVYVRNPSVNSLGFSQLNGFLQGEAGFRTGKAKDIGLSSPI